MNDGTLQWEGTRPAVRFERHLQAPPDVVWRALTDPEELKSWFPSDIVTDQWKVGATLTFSFRANQATPMTGTVLELEEPHRLVYTWGGDTLHFEMAPDPAGGTHLVFTDEVESNGVAARNAAGWEVCLDALAGALAGHPSGDGAWTPRFKQYSADFEPLVGAQEGPPPGFEEQAG